MSITLEQARVVVSATLAYGQEMEMNALCVAVLDAGGHLKAFEREDGVPNRRFEVAFGKAHGAISVGVSSRTLGTMAVERPHFVNGLIGSIPGLIPVPGGVIIIDDGGHAIGAVGVSGDTSDNDEAAALAGVHAAGLEARA